MAAKTYDLVIIGSGPAGLTAALYAARYNLCAVVLGKLPGGMTTEAFEVCNFPSYEKIPGIKLAMNMVNQVKKLGIEIKQENARQVKKKSGCFEVETNKGKYVGKKVLIATGTIRRKLGIARENELKGKGIVYCATCDGPFYKDKTIAVVGGGNSALTAALMMQKIAKKIYIIYRKDKFFRATPAWVKEVEKSKKIELVFNSNVKKLVGKDKLEAVELEKNGKAEKLKIDGLFIEIGGVPQNEIAKKLGLKLENDYIVVDKEQKTSMKGIFAAGDITNNHFKQIITACAEGATATENAYQEIVKCE